MIIEATDLRKLAPSIAGLVIMIAVGVSAILFTSRLGTQARAERDDARQVFSEADRKLRQIRSEEIQIRSNSNVFSELQKRGIVGEEQRLDWVELIKATQDNLRLREVRYEIAPQRSLDSKQNAAESALAFYASTMGLEMQLLHEEDLLRFLAEIEQRATALIHVRRCDLSRLSGNADNGVPHANLQAECIIDWITVHHKDVRARGETKP